MIVSYDPGTGRILGACEVQDEPAYLALLEQNGQGGVRLGIDGQVYYVKDGAIQPRPDSAVTLDKQTVGLGPDEFVTLSGVPAGATVRIVGPARGETEGTGEALPISFALPGVYEIQVEAFPARDAILRVSVEA